MSKDFKATLSIADVTLNEGQSSKEMLIVENEHGTLLVDNELSSMSFIDGVHDDIKIENKTIINGEENIDAPFLDVAANSLDLVFRAGYNLAVKLLKKKLDDAHTSIARGKIARDFVNEYFNQTNK